jgi:hypothetical protein
MNTLMVLYILGSLWGTLAKFVSEKAGGDAHLTSEHDHVKS